MNLQDADQIANEISLRCRREWSPARIASFATDLIRSSMGVVPVEVAQGALQRLLEELDPDAITLHKLVEAVKTRPVGSYHRAALPEPSSTIGAVGRAIIARRRAGIPDPEPNLRKREEMEDLLVRLGSRMHLRCVRCRSAFTPEDVRGYTQACMQAGREVEDAEPVRLCQSCARPAVELEDAPW